MKSTIFALAAAALLIAGAFMLSGNGSPSIENVSIEGGTQIVEITAKGGYSPKNTAAQAGIPTIVRVKTNGTFDCTSALKIPAISYEAMLPASGTTDIELSPQKSGTSVQGICAMGMYNFNIRFN